MLQPGDYIPDILGIGPDGKELHASEFAGKPLIIYFYPKDNTPGCTAEACSLRDYDRQLADAGYTVIGISKDTVESHHKFADKHSLPFLLSSDPDTTVNQTFGVWQKKKMAGREYMGTVRTTFVTDADHRITHVITKVNTKEAAPQLLDVIGRK